MRLDVNRLAYMTERSTGVRLFWRSTDPYPWLTWAGLCGLAVAIGFASFGLPPISLHGPLHFAGVMDPLCGMTRGTTATMRGEISEAMRFNPLSPLIPALLLATVVRSIGGRWSGRWLCTRYVIRPLPLALALIAVTALEVNQQLHADLLGG